MDKPGLMEGAESLLRRTELDFSFRSIQCTPLSADGSSRRFQRIEDKYGNCCLCVAPAAGDVAGLAEAASFYHIGRHLHRKGVPVPAMYGYAPESGLVICEDLGDIRLHDLIRTQGGVVPQVVALYEQVVRALAHMQVMGGEGFSKEWCWDTPVYDRELMLTRESGYFFQAFCVDYLQMDVNYEHYRGEFEQLAADVHRAQASFFLHRDCQSRNIMIKEEKVYFIDFQGGRCGPLGYDPASLLLDPYVGLDSGIKQHLLQVYMDELANLCSYDRHLFLREYTLIAIQRNLQILGAFAFLTKVKGKPFFQQYIFPALQSLTSLLSEREAADYKSLRNLVRQCRNIVESGL